MSLDLINDSTFKCGNCEEIFKVYSSSGDTNFCPCCGSGRSLEDYDEEGL